MGARDLEGLLSKIKEEQSLSGCVSEKFMADTASALGISVSEVYGVTTFYSFLSTERTGKHVIRICKSVPCILNGAEMIIQSIGKELGIGPGETTPDGRYTFELANCIGGCDMAPAMLVDDELHGDLTPEKIREILRSYE